MLVQTALAAPFVHTAKADQAVSKGRGSRPKTGPLAPGAAVTHFPPWRLWAHEVNQNGGLKLKAGRVRLNLSNTMIELNLPRR